MRFEDMKFYLNREFPFAVMSKGLGFGYVENDSRLKNQILNECELPFRGKLVSVPRYYVNKLEVPTAIKLEKSNLGRREMCSRLGIDVMYDLLHDCFGRVRHPRYADECEQRLRNLDAKAGLWNRQKL